MKTWASRGIALLGLALSGICAAWAEITVGLVLSTTGPAASLGIPERNTVALLPTRIAGHKVDYIVLDDASDSAIAVSNARKLIRDSNADIIVGPSITPNALALIDVVAEAETPMLALAASAQLVEPMDGSRAWVFKTPHNEAQMVSAMVEHMRTRSIRRVAFIGFADAYGEGWWKALASAAEVYKIAVVARQSFNGGDTVVGPQVTRILAAHPDAVFVAASGTPAALPHKALRLRGFDGPIYQTHGAANAEFLRVGGKDVDGGFLPAGPVLVAQQLPSDSPVGRVAREYVTRYESRYGKGSASTFGAHLWDAGLLLQRAIPEALKKAAPGTREFRRALRATLEGVRNLVGANGVVNMSSSDHGGVDPNSRVMMTIENGSWRLVSNGGPARDSK